MAETPRILVIDDEKEQGELIASTLSKKLGVEVTTITSAAKALNEIQTNKYDGYIIDLDMNEVSGPEFFFHLRKQDVENSKRIMFMVPKNIDPSLAMFLSTAPAIEVRFPVDIEEIADILSDILDDQY